MVIFVVANIGQGDPTYNMKKSWRLLLDKRLPKTAFAKLQYAVFGMGDSAFRLFNAMGRKLNTRMKQLGAQPIMSIGLGDDQHELGYFGAF